jgi:hypothetical protein
MKFTESDLIQTDNLIKSLKRAKFEEMQGMEILAFSQMFDWVGFLHSQIAKDLDTEKQKLAEKAQASQGIAISKAVTLEDSSKTNTKVIKKPRKPRTTKKKDQ